MEAGDTSIARAKAALAAVRAEEAKEIGEQLRCHRIVGLLGEAEVGKTEILREALVCQRLGVLYLDLAWAASEEHLGFMLAREIARMLVPADELPALGRLAPLPPTLERSRSRLAEMLGGGLKEALRPWPSGRYSLAAAFDGLEALAEQQETILWVDHLEAPRLTFRHPLKAGQLLWSVSELAERNALLRVVVSGREAASADALGPRAAFRGRGHWLTMVAPGLQAWQEVADRLGVSRSACAELVQMTAGHVRTMLLALNAIATANGAGKQPSAEDVLWQLAERDDGLASRAIEHARSLHRLGGQVLTQAALGQRPYATAQRGATTTQDLSKALKRLRLAGLLRHEQRWTVVNPLVAMRLRSGALQQAPSPAQRPSS
jgi:hypothetical protein